MKKFLKILVVLCCSLLLAAMCCRFLTDTAKYVWYSHNISSIEQAGNEGYWVSATQRKTWDEDISSQYERVTKNKENFIENSDVAKFHYYSGYSVTGKVVRVLAIAFAMITLYFSLSITCETAKRLIKKLFVTRKRARTMRAH